MSNVNVRANRVSVPATRFEGVRPKPTRRERRPIEQILKEADSPLAEAIYAVNRIGGLRLRMAKVLNSLSPEAQSLVRQQYPELAALMPQ